MTNMVRYHSDPAYRAGKLAAARRNAARRTPEQKRVYNLWHFYRLTPAAFEALLAAQDGRCGVCLRVPDDPQKMHVDHDHSCCSARTPSGSAKGTCGKCVRGLLCAPCNLGLGHWRDNAQHLLNAIDYLHRTQEGSDMAKAVQAVLFRWDSDFVDLLRATAGPRGMSGFVRRAIEKEMGYPSGMPPAPAPEPVREPETDFDNWGA